MTESAVEFNSLEITPVEPRARVTGDHRVVLRDQMAALYADGLSIREVGERTGRSYGAAHRMLQEAGVTLRRRGGRGKTA